MAQMQVFVSHSHEDDAFCRAIVGGLHGAGAVVWYDEHNLGPGHLMEVVQRELGRRPVAILILSKAAFASRWVRRESVWAYELLDRAPFRLLLPVTAGPIARDDFDPQTGWFFLHDFKRIEASGYQPYPTEEAVRRLLHALALTPVGERPAPTAPQPGESVADLVVRGKALNAQQRFTDAIPLFERATRLDTQSVDAWRNLSYALKQDGRYAEALVAHDRAVALDANQVRLWSDEGSVPNALNRNEAELAATGQALALDPNLAVAWYNQGNALGARSRFEEALAAYDRALALDPDYTDAWDAKGYTLYLLERHEEALAAYDRSFDRNDPTDWRAHAHVYRALGRTTEAEAAERRAKELGG